MKIRDVPAKVLAEGRRWRSLPFIRRPLLGVLIILILGILAFKQSGWFDNLTADDPAQWIGTPCAVTGVVASLPDAKPTGCVVTLDAETIEVFGSTAAFYSVQGPVLLHILHSTSTIIGPDDRLRVTGRLQSPRPAKTPGAFDYGSFLADRGIHALLYTSPHAVMSLGRAHEHSLLRAGWHLQRAALDLFYRCLPGDEAAVLAGLTVGVRPRFDPAIKRIFLESGTMHVLVASGSNVGFVIALWFLLVRILLRLPRRWTLLSALPAIWMYVLIVGADAPIARAGVMGTVGILAYALAREDHTSHALTLAALILLLINPRSLFDVGFQMSFITVFGLVHTLSSAQSWLSKGPRWISWPARLLATSLTAQMWLFPVTAAVFQQFYPISLLSNIFVVPMAGLGLAAGFILTVTHALHAPAVLMESVRWSAHIYLELFIRLVAFFAHHPGICLWIPAWGWFLSSCFYAVLLLIPYWNRSFLSRFVTIGAAAGLLTGALLRPAAKPSSNFSLTWIDTGRRLSSFLQTPTGQAFLFDEGLFEKGETSDRILLPFLANRRVRTLEALILRRPPEERLDELSALFQSLKIKSMVILNATDEDKNWIAAQFPARPVKILQTGESLSWPDVRLDILPTSPRFEDEPALRLRCSTTTIVLSRLLSTQTQDVLVEDKNNVDILQACFSERTIWRIDFVEKKKPRLCVETRAPFANRPSVPPWKKAVLAKPQESGWYSVQF